MNGNKMLTDVVSETIVRHSPNIGSWLSDMVYRVHTSSDMEIITHLCDTP